LPNAGRPHTRDSPTLTLTAVPRANGHLPKLLLLAAVHATHRFRSSGADFLSRSFHRLKGWSSGVGALGLGLGIAALASWSLRLRSHRD